ncbi:MAG: hypothetical protein KDA87_00035 [Planctomycetales bacterium]|nr:hypothetical protein [Planctomycetales bacterium]
MPVYVVGVPAPFGRQETWVKWVDPDPKFDQTPRWGRVNQGPESLMPERIRLVSSVEEDLTNPMDSGFGPYSLTRLCVKTGGIYFNVHPNRKVGSRVNRAQISSFSSHLSHFFDPQIMKMYQPEYVSAREYAKLVKSNQARRALVEAAQVSAVSQFESPVLRFVKTDEAALNTAMSQAQRVAARLEPRIDQLYQILRTGEQDRDKDPTPRWQAGYDLAYGRTLAAKVRTESYNAMLAMGKRGMEFKDQRNNVWVLAPADSMEAGSQYESISNKAKLYLQRVIQEHPGTPWALLASQELSHPLGWKWDEEFIDLAPRPTMVAANDNANNNTPQDEQARMLPKPPPTRPIPKL